MTRIVTTHQVFTSEYDRNYFYSSFAESGTKYFDSLTPFGDNQEYIKKLQQDIRDLRNDYSGKNRILSHQGNCKNGRVDKILSSPELKQKSPHACSKHLNRKESNNWDQSGNISSRNDLRTPDIDTLVRRSFWDDLYRAKEKIIRRNQLISSNISNKAREQEEPDSRDSWYRTSRRFSDSRYDESYSSIN